MTRDPDIDPEVLADLRLREQTARERPRSESQIKALYSWSAPKTIGKWKCRYFDKGCRAYVDFTEDTMAYWAKCNEWLRARGEQPLDTSTILICDLCRQTKSKARADRLRKERIEPMAELIRRLKESANPRGELGIITQLREWNHPCVDDLLASLIGKESKRGDRRL